MVAPKPVEFPATLVIETTIGGVKKWMESASTCPELGYGPG